MGLKEVTAFTLIFDTANTDRLSEFLRFAFLYFLRDFKKSVLSRKLIFYYFPIIDIISCYLSLTVIFQP